MAYFTRTALEQLIPPAFVLEALDDDSDGAEDTGLWEEVVAGAENEVNSFLERRYALPLAIVPAMVSEAAKIFACEILYQRRGQHGDKNPFTKRADGHRETLEKIATGSITFGPRRPRPSRRSRS